MSDLRFIQIGLNTIDLAASLRFYSEMFGFANAGGQCGWGDVMKLQDLPLGGQTLVWWMVGRHPRIQFEIFHHSDPLPRPQPKDWSPADQGWVRFGIAVGDFDGVTQRLAGRGIAPISETVTTNGLRRMAIRDPYCGVVIEIWEDGAGVPAMARQSDNEFDPLILYVTASVSDVAAARQYYTEILGMEIAPIETLHSESDEALWGLPGARRDGFLVSAGNGWIEVVEYREPRGRAPHPDHLLSDQGIMNIGLFSSSTDVIQAIIDRLDAEGNGPPWLTMGENLLGTYVNQPDREVELFSCPAHVEPHLGFQPHGQFNGGDFIKMVPRDAAKGG